MCYGMEGVWGEKRELLSGCLAASNSQITIVLDHGKASVEVNGKPVQVQRFFFFLHWRKKNLVTAQYVGDPGWGHSSASFCFQPLSFSVLSSSGGLHTYENHSSIDASGLFLICFPCLHPSPLSMFSFSLLLFTCSISHTDFCCLFLELAPNLLVPLFFLNSSSMYIPVYCQGEDTFFFFFWQLPIYSCLLCKNQHYTAFHLISYYFKLQQHFSTSLKFSEKKKIQLPGNALWLHLTFNDATNAIGLKMNKRNSKQLEAALC